MFSRASFKEASRDSSVGIGIHHGLVSPESNSGGDETLGTRSDGKWGPPSLLYNGYQVSLIRVKPWGRGVKCPLHLAQRLKE